MKQDKKQQMKNLLPGLLLLAALGAVLILFFLAPRTDRSREQLQTALLAAANTLRQGETAQAVTLTAGPEGPMVRVSHPINSEPYYTAYYCHRGMFYEQLYRQDHPFDPALGSALCPAAALVAEYTEGLLTLRLTGPAGETEQLSLHLQGQEGGGQ